MDKNGLGFSLLILAVLAIAALILAVIVLRIVSIIDRKKFKRYVPLTRES